MFIGHYAPAIAAAAMDRRAPRLGPLFVAAQFVDLAFFGLVLAGAEHMRETPGFTAMNTGDFYHMPYTHSLIGTAAFAALFAVLLRFGRATWEAAWIGAAVVASHWVLDWLVHAPDLTLFGTGPRYGLGLWNFPALEMPIELAIVFTALVFYAGRTRPVSRQGTISLAVLAVALPAIQLYEWLSPRTPVVVDPVPPSVPLTALVAYALFAAIAWWVGVTRERRP